MAAAFDVMDHDMPCVFCTRDLGSGEGERVLLLQCCMRGAHHTCLRDKFPDWNFVTCPRCVRRTRVTGQVLRRDKFTPEESDKIEYCLLFFHVSHRVFAVGLSFWFPLPKDKLCDWEDIVARLTLGLICTARKIGFTLNLILIKSRGQIRSYL